MCVSTGADVSPCTMYWVVCYGLWTWQRSWSWSWSLRGHGSFGGGRDSYCGNRMLLIKDSGNINIAGGITTSLRSARRSLVALNGHSWMMLTLLPLMILLIHAPSATHAGSSDSPIVVLSQEYNRLHQFEFSQNSHSVTHASSSGMNAYIISP